jgi:hypothetical protein
MEKDVLIAALQGLVIKQRKGLEEVKHYLRTRYHLEVDNLVLSKRLEKISLSEKGIA